jgi:hypothetical protein
MLSTCSLGFHGIVFDSLEPVKRALRNLTGDPPARGQAFLHESAGNLVSVTENSDNHEAVLLQDCAASYFGSDWRRVGLSPASEFVTLTCNFSVI